MESTAQRSEISTPATEAVASRAAHTVSADDHYFLTSADGAPRIDGNVQLASTPPWLGALVVIFLLSLVVGTALRRTLLRHSGPDFPHAADEGDTSRSALRASRGIRAHLRPAPVRLLRRARG